MKTGSAYINGAEIHYDEAGTGPAVVFLHAGISDRRLWDAQMPVFARDWRALRYDLRGFGQSTMPPGDYSHIDDLRALLDHWGVERAHLIGVSSGGRVALEFALEQPARVSSLVLCAPSLRGYDYSEQIGRYAEANDAAAAAGDIARAVALDTQMWIDGPKRRPETVDPAFRARAQALAADVYRHAQEPGAERPLQPPALDRLWQIAAPALVLVGEYETPDFINIAGMVAFALARAEKAMIPGAAHLLPMEQPDAFNARALAFLSAQENAERS